MQTNPFFSNRTNLDAFYSPKDGGISFHKGELLQGLVKEIRPDGLVMLLLKGRLIEAATQVRVETGQNLMLMVDEVGSGQMRLKVMNPTGSMKDQSDNNIAARLTEIGISPRTIDIQLAKYLLAYNLPLNRFTLELMSKGVAILGEATPENINLTAFQLSRNLPQHPAILQALAQYMDPTSDVNSLRQDIARLIASAPAEPLVAGKDLFAPVLSMISQAVGSQEAQASQSPTALASQIEEILHRQPELLRGLLLLQNLLEVFIKEDGRQGQAAVLHSRLQSFSAELLGQQVVNLVPPPASGDLPQFYFAFALPLGEEQRLCEFRIYGEEGQASLKNREQINVAVSLDTPRLGPIVFHISWHATKLIEMRSVVTKPESCRVMAPHLPELHQALRELGYTVKDYGMKVVHPGSPDTIIKVLPQPPAKPDRLPRLRVDIRI